MVGEYRVRLKRLRAWLTNKEVERGHVADEGIYNELKLKHIEVEVRVGSVLYDIPRKG